MTTFAVPFTQLFVTSRDEATLRLLPNVTPRFSHLISIGDFTRTKPVDGHENVDHVLPLYFDDITIERPGYKLVDAEIVEKILAFGREIPTYARVLIHCEAGISRSTAAALIILAERFGPGNEHHAFDAMLGSRSRFTGRAAPNERMVIIADTILGREGALRRLLRRSGLRRVKQAEEDEEVGEYGDDEEAQAFYDAFLYDIGSK